jgi:2-polyprenyl-3-methyl-5-hydroxy-6-metoxy-1,4-benzoquinol methylase
VGDDGAVIAPAVHKSSEYSLPEDNDPNYAKLMRERYEIAAAWVTGKRIADACSGPGYGMPILRRSGAEVIGFDRAPENAITAKVRDFGYILECDVTTQAFEGFDSVVSLETWEHLPDPIPWFRGFAPSVKEVVISCPCIPTKHMNEHHLADYGYDEMLNIVRAAGWTVREHRRQRDDVILLHAVRD